MIFRTGAEHTCNRRYRGHVSGHFRNWVAHNPRAYFRKVGGDRYEERNDSQESFPWAGCHCHRCGRWSGRAFMRWMCGMYTWQWQASGTKQRLVDVFRVGIISTYPSSLCCTKFVAWTPCAWFRSVDCIESGIAEPNESCTPLCTSGGRSAGSLRFALNLFVLDMMCENKLRYSTNELSSYFADHMSYYPEWRRLGESHPTQPSGFIHSLYLQY